MGVPPTSSAWNTWFSAYGNDPARLAPLQASVDQACRDAGRDPATLDRTAAVLVRFPAGSGRPGAADPPSRDRPSRWLMPCEGSPPGIDHVQLVLDPITLNSIKALGSILKHLDQRA